MRKLFLLWLMIVGAFCIHASADFYLPTSLTVIEDEAFAGTAIGTVVMPDTLAVIGDRAFANIPTLRSVEIPQSVLAIGDNAFTGSENVFIVGAAGSYAQMWANEHYVLFVEAKALTETTPNPNGITLLLGWLLSGTLVISPKFDYSQYSILHSKIRIRRRLAELYPVLYDFP